MTDINQTSNTDTKDVAQKSTSSVDESQTKAETVVTDTNQIANTDTVTENVTHKRTSSVDESKAKEEIIPMDTTSTQNEVPQIATPKKTSGPKKLCTSKLLENTYCQDEPDLLDSVLENTSNKQLIDRLLGCAYGQALGDAYGLATEFEDRYDVDQKYPDRSKKIPFPDYKKTNHNRRWKTGDWTDDTDQWILILDTVAFCNGDVKEFAAKLKGWIERGYPELGDFGGMGIGANVYQVVCSYDFVVDPLRVSEDVWRRGGCNAAPNGAVMRCSASAFFHYNDREKMLFTTEQLAKTTHFDPRCISSCLAICLAIHYLLTEENVRDDIEGLIKRVQDETIEIIGERFSEQHRELFLWHTNNRTLEELNLDEPNRIGYTYKCLASGFYGLRSTRTFEETLNDLIRYGGDADTNGAVCGTMYGARYGYSALPYDWLRQMPYKKWFDQKLINCFQAMKLETNESDSVEL